MPTTVFDSKQRLMTIDACTAEDFTCGWMHGAWKTPKAYVFWFLFGLYIVFIVSKKNDQPDPLKCQFVSSLEHWHRQWETPVCVQVSVGNAHCSPEHAASERLMLWTTRKPCNELSNISLLLSLPSLKYPSSNTPSFLTLDQWSVSHPHLLLVGQWWLGALLLVILIYLIEL